LGQLQLPANSIVLALRPHTHHVGVQVHLPVPVAWKGVEKAEHQASFVDGAKHLAANLGANHKTTHWNGVCVRKAPCQPLNLNALAKLINVVQELNAVRRGFGHCDRKPSAALMPESEPACAKLTQWFLRGQRKAAMRRQTRQRTEMISQAAVRGKTECASEETHLATAVENPDILANVAREFWREKLLDLSAELNKDAVRFDFSIVAAGAR
jgi:hypothetical protein